MTITSLFERRLLVPEVLQTSTMDCGPAALSSLLQGLRVPVSYRHLREACHTHVDGTSIDTLEEVASTFGLEADQLLIPVEHLLCSELGALPALAVVVQPSGLTHFVVLWNRIAGRLQIMDPSSGRRWLTRRQLEAELFFVRRPVAAADFREYAASAEFLSPLCKRITALVPRGAAESLLSIALADPSWRSLAALDASVRVTEMLARSRVTRSASEAHALIARWFEQCRDPARPELAVPERYWYAAPIAQPAAQTCGDQQLSLNGVVVVRVREPTRSSQRPLRAQTQAFAEPEQDRPRAGAASAQSTPGPFGIVWRMLERKGQRKLLALGAVSALAAMWAILESLLLRSRIDLDQRLNDRHEQFILSLAALCLIALLTAIELPLAFGAARLGRKLETRLRMAFMWKLPRLRDSYLQSRPISDLADRCHMVHHVRLLPTFVLSALRVTSGLLATGAGMVWLDPSSARRVAIASVLSLAVPLLLQRFIAERDGAVRGMVGRLSRFYFDALRGLVMIRAHGGMRSFCAEHDAQASAWKRAGLALAHAGLWLDTTVALVSVALSSWLFLSYIAHVGEPVGALLFLYWALSFPAYGRDLSLLSRQLPMFVNIVARLVEPLGADEALAAHIETRGLAVSPSFEFESVTVQAMGNTVLSDINLRIQAGQHVAIIGSSGAGKSTLVSLLLGWHRPSQGRILCNGEELSDQLLQQLRERTAWVDPSVQLFNRSLYDNLLFGSRGSAESVDEALTGGALQELSQKLPEGLRTILGEGGARLSGGEAQRVRFARALLHTNPDLVICDEPFRGLDCGQRSELMASARRKWCRATLLCVTHDVAETRTFPRVLVIEGGQIVEDGVPRELALRANSHYAKLLRAERDFSDSLHARAWRQLRLRGGALEEKRTRACQTSARDFRSSEADVAE